MQCYKYEPYVFRMRFFYKFNFSENINIQNVIDMSYIFCRCYSLLNLNLPNNFNTKSRY